MKYFSCLWCLWWLLVGVIAQPGSLSAEVIDKIVAILDHDLILLSEIREQTETPVVQVFANLSATENSEQEALRYIVERRLLQREIQYLAAPKEEDFVRTLALRYLANAYYHGNAEALLDGLRARGISSSDRDDELLLYMKGVDYIRRKYRFNANVSDPEVVLNLFQNWIKELTTKATLQQL